MNAKKIVGSVFGVGAIIVSSVLLKKSLPKETAKIATEAVAEKKFRGIPISKLNEIAKSIDLRDYCTIEQWGFLVLHYKSNRGHQNFQTQLDLDGACKLFNLNGGPVFPGQRWSHASEFVKRVNEEIKFT